MLEMNVQSTIAQGLKKLTNVAPRAWPAIIAHGFNKTMVTVRAEEKREIERVFDRPTPYTLRGFYTKPAKPADLTTSLSLKDFGGKGTPAAKYLAPQIYGGNRSLKRFERALNAKGILPGGMFAVPANGAPLDTYGNLRGSFIVQILSGLQAFAEQGYVANRVKGRTQKREFFAVSPNNPNNRGLPFGVYERKGKGFSMVLAFVRQPQYKQRFDFYGVGERTAAKYLSGDIAEAARLSLERGYGRLTMQDIPDIIGL